MKGGETEGGGKIVTQLVIQLEIVRCFSSSLPSGNCCPSLVNLLLLCCACSLLVLLLFIRSGSFETKRQINAREDGGKIGEVGR